jgi:polyphosphate kinase
MAEGLLPYLKDNLNAWQLDADGTYQRARPRGRQAPFGAQQFLMHTVGQDEAP